MKTLFPVTALIALVAAAPLAWAQEAHDTNAPAGDDASAQADAQSDTKTDAQNAPDNSAVAMAAAQPATICNHRNGTVACSIKSTPHDPGVRPVNPANQSPAPAQ